MGDMDQPEHIKILETWMKSYEPDKLFDEAGKLIPELRTLAPTGTRRMGANPHANGGVLIRDHRMPDFCKYAVTVPHPGAVQAEATRIMGAFLRDVMKLNSSIWRARIFASFLPMKRRPTAGGLCLMSLSDV